MERFLPQLVKSIARNTFTDIELLIIDDGSTDNTPAVVKLLQEQCAFEIRYYFCRHRGKAGSLNYVLQNGLAAGKYIAFSDADDLLPNQSLEHRYNAAVSSGAELVIGGFALTDLQGNHKEKRVITCTVSAKELVNRFFFSPKTPFHLNSTIISKALVTRVGLFDETLTRGQEVEYAVRLLKEATEISILNEIVYLYRQYERPLRQRLNIRLKTTYHRCRTISKHLNGTQRIKATALHWGCDFLKLGYELLRPRNR